MSLPIETDKFELELVKEFKRAKFYYVKETPTCILEVTESYIPIEEFQLIFNSMTDFIAKKGLKKFIFDKRNMKVFHQPSMEWYFTEWKDQLYDLGLLTIRKLLPDDKLFALSVENGKKIIDLRYPNGRYTQMDIQYKDSIEEAIES